jgi:hypothetical protein
MTPASLQVEHHPSIPHAQHARYQCCIADYRTLHQSFLRTERVCQSLRMKQAMPYAVTVRSNKVPAMFRVASCCDRHLSGFRAIINSIRLFLSVALHVDLGLSQGLGTLLLQVFRVVEWHATWSLFDRRCWPVHCLVPICSCRTPALWKQRLIQ